MNPNDLGREASKKYDEDYTRGVADLICGKVTLAYVKGASDTCAGKAYDVDKEQGFVQPVDAVVDRFLCWKLPEDFNPDGGVSFSPSKRLTPDDLSWPVGTNLFTADQAKQMFLHCLSNAADNVAGVTGCTCTDTIRVLADALRLAEKYLVDRHIEYQGTVGRTLVLPTIRKAIQLADKQK
jgi:hypothetical protein